jgi:hypothetical protein
MLRTAARPFRFGEAVSTKALHREGQGCPISRTVTNRMARRRDSPLHNSTRAARGRQETRAAEDKKRKDRPAATRGTDAPAAAAGEKVGDNEGKRLGGNQEVGLIRSAPRSRGIAQLPSASSATRIAITRPSQHGMHGTPRRCEEQAGKRTQALRCGQRVKTFSFTRAGIPRAIAEALLTSTSARPNARCAPSRKASKARAAARHWRGDGVAGPFARTAQGDEGPH